jgi:hypothetical protein
MILSYAFALAPFDRSLVTADFQDGSRSDRNSVYGWVQGTAGVGSTKVTTAGAPRFRLTLTRPAESRASKPRAAADRDKPSSPQSPRANVNSPDRSHPADSQHAIATRTAHGRRRSPSQSHRHGIGPYNGRLPPLAAGAALHRLPKSFDRACARRTRGRHVRPHADPCESSQSRRRGPRRSLRRPNGDHDRGESARAETVLPVRH